MTRLAALLGALLLLAGTLPAEEAVIREVRVTAREVTLPSTDFVHSYIAVKAGEPLDRRRISRDVKTLQESGRFAFVDTRLDRRDDGLVLTYLVELKPRLARPIAVSGNDAVSVSRIREWLGLEVGDPVDQAELAVRGRKVREEYRKRYYPDCDLKWDLTVDEATAGATVSLTVSEGRRAKLRRFAFVGNRVLSGSELAEPLEDQLYVWYLSWLTDQGRYDPDQLEANRAVLRRLYQDRGYLDVDVSPAEIILYRRGNLRAQYRITEGPLYRLGALELGPTTVFAHSNLMPLVRLRAGDVASLARLDETANAIRDYYQSRGYIRASVRPVIHSRQADQIADVTFDIREGRQVHLRYVDIKGNTRTQDAVIRRELLVYPGEVFDQPKVRRSERILQNLGFFSTVTSYPLETSDPTRDDLVFEVEETRTGQFMVGAGYSTVDEIMGSARTDYELSFVEPWFLGRKLSLGVDLYQHTLGYLSDEYTQRQTGGALTLGKAIPTFFQRVELRYSLDQYDIYDVSTNASDQVRAEEGKRMQSKMGLTFIHDTRDNPFIPTRGARLTVGAYVAGGPLGFDTDFYGFESRLSQYWTLWWRHVFSIRAWAAVVEEYGDDDDVHLPDRLYLGGPNSLRGFKFRRVGPTDARTGEPRGGKSAAMASAEYTVPVIKFVRAATFYDIGNVWLDAYDFELSDYCTDIGLGLRLDIPGFPIRLDYAWPLEVTENVYRTAPRFNFSIGYAY
jgi:outer membrane protein insertion porin family